MEAREELSAFAEELMSTWNTLLQSSLTRTRNKLIVVDIDSASLRCCRGIECIYAARSRLYAPRKCAACAAIEGVQATAISRRCVRVDMTTRLKKFTSYRCEICIEIGHFSIIDSHRDGERFRRAYFSGYIGNASIRNNGMYCGKLLLLSYTWFDIFRGKDGDNVQGVRSRLVGLVQLTVASAVPQPKLSCQFIVIRPWRSPVGKIVSTSS